MLIIDAHLDLSWNALQWNRNLLNSVYTIRTQENRTEGKGRALGTVAFPEMRQGRVTVSFATVLARSTGQPAPHIDYGSRPNPMELLMANWPITGPWNRRATFGSSPLRLI